MNLIFGVFMGAFLKELRTDLRSSVPWVLFVTIAVVVAVAGPFGSYGVLPLMQRVLFWTPVILMAALIGTIVRAFVHGTLGMRGRLSGSLLIAALNCAVLCPPLLVMMNSLFPPVFGTWSGVFEVCLLVASLSLGVGALRFPAEPALAAAERPPVVAEPVVEHKSPRLARRLDEARRGEIWAISVRDHYVDVHTSLGKSSLLMRFSDATAEVDCVAGAKVHRSHWVGWAGVGAVSRDGGKMVLHLKNGQLIPVSRNNRDKVDARFPASDPVRDGEMMGAA